MGSNPTSPTIKRYMVWEEQKLRRIVEESVTIAECLRKLGLCTRGNNFRTFRRKAEKWGVNYEHFDKNASKRARDAHKFKRSVPNTLVFCENSKVSSRLLRQRYIEINKLIKCEDCGISDEYNDKPITLQIDHKNGIRNDNRLVNLRWLCPNCHSQTETYGTKGKSFNKKKKGKLNPSRQNKGRATKGMQYPKERKVDYVEVIKKFKEIGSYLGTAKVLGISDNAVKKIIKRYDLVNGEVVRCWL